MYISIGNLGKLYDAIREREYAAANSSYAPPVSFASVVGLFCLYRRALLTLSYGWHLFFYVTFLFYAFVWQGGLLDTFLDQLGGWSAGHYKALVVDIEVFI